MTVKGVVLNDGVGMRLCARDRSYCRNLRGVMAVSTCGEQETSVWAGEMDSVGQTRLVEEREEGGESWGKIVFSF